MKKTIAILALLLMFCAACGNQVEQNYSTTTEKTETLPQTTTTLKSSEEEWPEGYGDPQPKTYRPIYYDLAFAYVELIGRDAYLAWEQNRVENNFEQYENECIAVSFVRAFNISKEDFSRANEARRKLLADRGQFPEDLSSFELYPVDLIYTFDNEKINEFFLWEGSIYAHEAE